MRVEETHNIDLAGLSVCLSKSLSVYLPHNIDLAGLSVCLSKSLSVYLPHNIDLAGLSVCLSKSLSVYLPHNIDLAGLSVCLSLCLSICLTTSTEQLRLFSFDGVDPPNTVPDSQTSIFMRVSGQVFNKERVENLFSPGDQAAHQDAHRLWRADHDLHGAAAYSTRYLDHSKQWKELPAGLRDQALEFIRAGYTRILTYKKKDGSYGAWIHYDSSTWLTASVLKTLSQVHSYADVQNEEIEDPASYLLTQQLHSGEFHDPKPVIHRDADPRPSHSLSSLLQGGVGGVDSRISLTAFVTIALHHSLAAQTGEKLQRKDAIDKSTEYLQDKILKVNRPYSLAISAYALALTKPDSSAAHQAVEILKSQAIEDRGKTELQGEDKAHLVPQAQAITVETTAYGLLAALANREQELAESVYRWLSEQQNYGGGFRSTQVSRTWVQITNLHCFKHREDTPQICE
ncbi:complement C4 [Acipenser oxyrinchus oxyrinchus]|uniref:Complement C4 n=1 Tax=Acipenser oxyrinchus oxyrinchus TaxID=40147 RepID=A0AAD8CDP6_ACIOX|nr:complement C4 [Acipenser oxyrinchus oxyrinchus]